MDKWLQNNTIVKLIAVALAMMLWMSVNDTPFHFLRNERAANTIQNVTLEARYDDTRLELTEIPPTVDLTLRGNTFTLNLISPERYRAYVDLREMRAGKHSGVPVRLEGIPKNVEYQINPARVNVVLEEKLQKEMPVEVEVIGKPDADFELGEPIVTPDKVLVRGTESRLKEVKAVKAVVNTEGATDTIEESVSLQVYGEKGWLDGVEVTPEMVSVSIPVESQHTEVSPNMDSVRYPPTGLVLNRVRPLR